MNLGDLTINAAGGCAIAFVGSWGISLLRGIKLLDNDRAIEVATAKADRETSQEQILNLLAENAELKKPRRSPAEQIKFVEAKQKLGLVSDQQLRVMHALISREQIRNDELRRKMANDGLPESEWMP